MCLGGAFVFMDDGAPARRRKDVVQWGKETKVTGLPHWPPTSPDLNVIDFMVWSVTRKFVSDHKPGTGEELQTATLRAAKASGQGGITKAC